MIRQTLFDQEYEQLLENPRPTAVSICVPTDSLNPDPRTNSIAFKNLISTASSWLKQLDSATTTLLSLETASENLLADELFWKEQAESFVVLVAGDQVKSFKLTKKHPQLVMVNNHYYIVPFISELTQESTFYVLELDKEKTKVWRGSKNTFEAIEVPNLPRSIEEVTGTETGERHLQFHTGTDAPGSGKRAAMYHGSSSWKDDKDRYLERFLKAVDSAMIDFLNQRDQPLLLSGVEEATVIFQNLSNCKNLQIPALPKIPDPTHKEKTLHQLSWELVSERLQEHLRQVVTAFEETVPAKRAAVFPDVLRQAAQGKVDTLLIAENTHVWGLFDSKLLTTAIDQVQQPTSSELLNVAARLTLMNSGKVVVLPREKIPEQKEALAILRY